MDPSRIVLVGVGNRMKGDDAIGPVLLDSLQGFFPHCIDTGNTPEEYTNVIKRLNPSVIIFLDALDLGAAPGEMRIIEPSGITRLRGSTHTLSLDLILEYLKEETRADVFVIGLQYASISAEPGLSPGMDEAVRVCAEAICSSIGRGS